MNIIKNISIGLGLGFILWSSQGSTATSIIKIDGSSTVFPITEAVSEEYQKSKRGKIRVTVGISGTGGGFKKFCRGETDVQNASRPIKKSEMKDCKKAGVQYFEIPVAYDATTVIVSPKNKWLKELTVEELKKIWEPKAQGKIMKWSQVNKNWPNTPIKLYGPGADSGTFDYFTEAIVGKSAASRGDYTASEDDNTLVLGVSSDVNALGYLPYAYFEPNQTKLRAIPIKGGKNAPSKLAVAPSKKTVENGTYFPLSRPIFVYVSSKSYIKPEVKEFTDFYLTQAPSLVKEVKYVQLPNSAYSTAKKNLKGNKLGTAFGGEAQIGLKIEELLERKAKL